MVEEHTPYGVHQDGESLTYEEYMGRQYLDVVRFMQVLARQEHAIRQGATAEECHNFRQLLRQVLVSVDGDPNEEWREYNLHRDQQFAVMKALFESPEGIESFYLFAEHIAPLYGDAARNLRLPMEQLDQGIVQYIGEFSTVPNDLTYHSAEHGKPISFAEALRLMKSEEQIICGGVQETRLVTSEVLAPFISEEDGSRLPKQVVLDAVVSPTQLEVHKHRHAKPAHSSTV